MFTSTLLEFLPFPNNPLVFEDAPAGFSLVLVKSPKLVEFPVVAIVTCSMEDVMLGLVPPANIPIVEEAQLPLLLQ